MGEARWRGDNRNDPLAQKVMDNPAVKEIAEAHHGETYDRHHEEIGAAIDQSDGRRLKGWVAVAVWEDVDGTEGETLFADGDSTSLELKGYLHDGVWMAAHSE